MTRTPRHALLAVVPLLLVAACGGSDDAAERAATPEISGRIEDGLRVLTFDDEATDQRFVVYRGDYVRPELASGGTFRLQVPELDVDGVFPPPGDQRPYFKVPEAGDYAFAINDAGGTIEAVEYVAREYREVDAQGAAGLVAKLEPLVLDVRTPREYEAGHLEDAMLIPVQELERRIDELQGHEDEPVLVYCASGNRSTVASRMLIDAGFDEVINLRTGFRSWQREGLPVEK